MTAPHVGVWLITLGFITKRQLLAAMEQAKAAGDSLEQALIAGHALPSEELSGALALQEDLSRSATLKDLPLPAEVLGLVPTGFAVREHVLPLRACGRRLIVAHAQAAGRGPDQRMMDQLGTMTGLLVHGIAFNPDDLAAALSHHYAQDATRQVVERAVAKSVPTAGASPALREALEVKVAADSDAPVIDLVNKILAQAVQRRASDVHIRPTHKGLTVKLRLDGVMQPLMELPAELGQPVVARLKVMAEMNIAERRRPQDGRCSISIGGARFDLRVASINSHWGEMIVMRILRPLSMGAGYGELGLGGDSLARWQRITQAPNGLILVTGPTGSGKTSTLYTTLTQFDRSERNILTVEDPVEYPVPGIGQIQVMPSVGLTFAAALRTLLRLDPDVILVGEIRDHETLEVALEAAQTGHLVLSTMHTNDAVAAVGRMIEMGAPRHQVAATLVGVLAQRLVRRSCVHCLKPAALTGDERAFLRLAADDEHAHLRQAVGCDICDGIGYLGRIALYEVLEVDATFADAISAGDSPHALWRRALGAGMETLIDDGRAKALANQTTAQEVLRVVGPRSRGQ